MTILSRLASALGRNDDESNKELARELVEKKDIAGIKEAAENIRNKDKLIQRDCLSVLEHVGTADPELIEEYAADFLDLIFSKENRTVWAAMIDLALVADRKPSIIFDRFEDIVKIIESGSVISIDRGILALAKVASAGTEYSETIMPFLLGKLRTCRPKSVPQYAESISIAVNPETKEEYLSILKDRMDILSSSQQKRVKKLIKAFE